MLSQLLATDTMLPAYCSLQKCILEKTLYILSQSEISLLLLLFIRIRMTFKLHKTEKCPYSRLTIYIYDIYMYIHTLTLPYSGIAALQSNKSIVNYIEIV